MKTILKQITPLLLLAIFSGENSCVAEAFLFRKCVRADHHYAKGKESLTRNISLVINRGGGVEPSLLARSLLPSLLSRYGRSRPGTTVASTNGSTTTFVPPKYDKSGEKETFIEGVLKSNFIFNDASASKISEIVAAFEEVEFDEGSCICKQGDLDDADYLYVIYEGECKVSVDGNKLAEPYGTMNKGNMFGVLMMINDAPWAATVTASTPVKAFRLHRDVVDSFLNSKSTDGKSSKEELRRELREIDTAIDRIVGVKTEHGGDIIPQFKADRVWLWRQWKGTILQQAWKPAVFNMVMSIIIIFSFRFTCNKIIHEPITWSIGKVPDSSHPIVSHLMGLSKLWNKALALVTFVLTFFLGQAFTLWKTIYGKARELQGNLNDLSLTAACRAERDPKTDKYTPRASKALEDVATSIRLFSTLAWSFLARKYNVLLTPKGMSRMLSRGIMTKKQYDVLTSLPPNASLPETVLQWIFVRLTKGIDEGVWPKTRTVEDVFTGRVLELRKSLNAIRLTLLGKIPVAYAHFVQFLVDCCLFLAPFALYPEMGFWSIPAVGLLNLFYGGLLNLSKILMFPLENDDSEFTKDTSVNMDIGVLIRETNAGSSRFKSSIENLPF